MEHEEAVWMCRLGITPRFLESLIEQEHSFDEIAEEVSRECGWDARPYELRWLAAFYGIIKDA